jgi:DNA-binding MurR/RpiR family transcriptional regulator
MSYQTRIRESREGMTRSFSRLADFLLDSYVDAAFLSASDLAKRLSLDPATVVRFAQSLGYSGYPELLQEVQEQVKAELLLDQANRHDPTSAPGSVATALDEVREVIEQLKVSLDAAAVVELVECIGRAGRTLVIAEGSAQPSAYTLVYALEQGDFPVSQVAPGLSGLARALHNAGKQDLWITIDFSGEAPYLAPALREARARGVTTAVIAGAPSLASTYAADVVLAGRSSGNQALQIMAIAGIIYALLKTLQAIYPERYRGARESIANLTSMLQ